MAELSERHEVRVRGKDSTIVFSADSTDGKLVIRQELDGRRPKDGCAITLSDPEELRGFFKGLRRIMASLGTIESPGRARLPSQEAASSSRPDDEREAIVANARARNPQAFAPWTKTKRTRLSGAIRLERVSRPSPARRSARRVPSSLGCSAWGLWPANDCSRNVRLFD